MRRRTEGARRQGSTLVQMVLMLAAILVLAVGVLDLWAALLPATVLAGLAAALVGALVVWSAARDGAAG